MRRFLSILSTILLTLPFIVSCQKEEATLTTNGETVSNVVVKSFEKRFPTAQNVMWEKNDPYWIARFDLPVTKAVAADPRTNSTWFDNSGNWQMSEHDIDYSELPLDVRKAFEASRYATWEKDDIQTLERDGVITLYMIEVEQKNEQTNEEVEMELYWTINGILTKELTSTEDHTELIPEKLPATILEDLKVRFGNFEAIEIEKEDKEFEVEIFASGRVCELKYLVDSFEWLSTEYDITLEEFPGELMELIKNEIADLDSFEFDDIEVIETKDGRSYKIELENVSTDKEIEIFINVKGEISIK